MSAKNKGGTTIDDLPAEILLEVFKYLRLRERSAAMLVCRRWNRAGFESKHWYAASQVESGRRLYFFDGGLKFYCEPFNRSSMYRVCVKFIIYILVNPMELQMRNRWKKTLDVTARDVRKINALGLACYLGKLELAQWFASEFNLTTEDARAQYVLSLRAACNNGNLELVQWLHSRFNLTSVDARMNSNEAINLACQRGYADVVKWLYTTYDLYGADSSIGERIGIEEGIQLARKNGHLEIHRWLHLAVLHKKISMGYDSPSAIPTVIWIAATVGLFVLLSKL